MSRTHEPLKISRNQDLIMELNDMLIRIKTHLYMLIRIKVHLYHPEKEKLYEHHPILRKDWEYLVKYRKDQNVVHLFM